jgi:hypothetical protein
MHYCSHVGGTYRKVPEHSAVNFMIVQAVKACLNMPACFILYRQVLCAKITK